MNYEQRVVVTAGGHVGETLGSFHMKRRKLLLKRTVVLTGLFLGGPF